MPRSTLPPAATLVAAALLLLVTLAAAAAPVPLIKFVSPPADSPIYREPSLTAKKAATVPKCGAVRVFRSTYRPTTAKKDDSLCWGKVTYGKVSGWMPMWRSSNAKDKCNPDTAVQSFMTETKPEGCPAVAKEAYCPSFSSFNFASALKKDIIKSLPAETAQSCCYECGLEPACVAFSFSQAKKTCDLTSNALQAPVFDAAYTSHVVGTKKSTAGTAYVSKAAPPLVVYKSPCPTSGKLGTVKPCAAVTVDFASQSMASCNVREDSCWIRVVVGGKKGYIKKAVGGTAPYSCSGATTEYLTLAKPAECS